MTPTLVGFVLKHPPLPQCLWGAVRIPRFARPCSFSWLQSPMGFRAKSLCLASLVHVVYLGFSTVELRTKRELLPRFTRPHDLFSLQSPSKNSENYKAKITSRNSRASASPCSACGHVIYFCFNFRAYFDQQPGCFCLVSHGHFLLPST